MKTHNPHSAGRSLVVVCLLLSVLPIASQAQALHTGADDRYTPSYYNVPSGPSPAEIRQQQARAQAAAEKVTREREAARVRAQEIARVKAKEQDQWRQKSNSMMDAFKTGLTGGGSSGGPGDLPKTPPAPWGFGPGRLDVSPQQAGIPPQPDGATFVTDDGQVRSTGAVGGNQNYVDNYVATRELAGNPLPADFFDRDPAVVSYDSIGNPIDRDGFVVEYQNPAERQAAIIEQRQAAVEFALQGAADARLFDRMAAWDPSATSGSGSTGAQLGSPSAEILAKEMRENAQITKKLLDGKLLDGQPVNPLLTKAYSVWSNLRDRMIKAGGVPPTGP
jgi:hypothetical protein